MKYKHFTIQEREQIQLRLWQKESLRAIATKLGRSPSSISRELKRHPPPKRHPYHPRLAHKQALQARGSRGRNERLKSARVRHYVISHLKLRWSPEQIAGRIKIDIGYTISYEAIYQFIYAQIHRDGYGYLKLGHIDLRSYLRRRRKRRVPKGARRSQQVFRPRGVSIDLRPSVVDARNRIGDWEGDTVSSRDNKVGINTLVERKTGLVLISKLKDKTAQATNDVVVDRLKPLPEQARYTLTLDNGPENSGWQKLEREANISVYYAHPYHSWERGTNENTNGLIRDYFPKKTDFTTIPDALIARVEYDLNNRPRKRLNYRTPLEAMSVALEG